MYSYELIILAYSALDDLSASLNFTHFIFAFQPVTHNSINSLITAQDKQIIVFTMLYDKQGTKD